MTPPVLEIDPMAHPASASTGAEIAEYALALFDLGGGRWSESLERLQSMRNTGLAIASLPDQIEAAVRLGERSAAHAALQRFADCAACSESAWWQARLAMARALVAEGAAATRHFEDALRLVSESRQFDRARILLLYGEHLRRARRRCDARLRLREALEAFEELHAGPWAERARTELRASGETARKRDASTIDQLTPQELQISRFVAEGLANKEVAVRLFLSPRTIDYHLRNIFAKLGITSRTQLARFALADEPVSVAAAA
jgi:DNA-binding CsgD family transcriptional regulator